MNAHHERADIFCPDCRARITITLDPVTEKIIQWLHPAPECAAFKSRTYEQNLALLQERHREI